MKPVLSEVDEINFDFPSIEYFKKLLIDAYASVELSISAFYERLDILCRAGYSSESKVHFFYFSEFELIITMDSFKDNILMYENKKYLYRDKVQIDLTEHQFYVLEEKE
jgi:hypothetical protein